MTERLVKIIWIDPTSESAWQNEKEIDKWAIEVSKEKCISVGWIIRENKDYIIIASDRNDAGEWANTNLIYKSLVQSIKNL